MYRRIPDLFINKENTGRHLRTILKTMMKLQDEHIQQIRSAFNKMKSKEDFLALLNSTKKLIYGEKFIPFELKHLNYHSNQNTNPKRYIQFEIKKKSGKKRKIHSPNKGLKSIQKCLNLIFQLVYDVGPSAYGFVPKKSIVDNAKVHVGNLYVYNIDLKDFFPSIDRSRVWGRLKVAPFNLNEKSGNAELADIIASICCQEMEVERMDENGEWKKSTKNVLPQGAPTSPTLTNIICQQLDFYLNAVAKRFGLKYSRYADDITFSSMNDVYGEKSEIINKKGNNFYNELRLIIMEQKFQINEAKTRLQRNGFRQEVTGLIVNEKVNVPQRYIKQLRMWLYYWESYGYEKACTFFLPQYIADKGHTKKGKPNLENVISGKLDYLKMVKGPKNEMYLKLEARFAKLAEVINPINEILDIWEKEGIEKAIIVYNNTLNN